MACETIRSFSGWGVKPQSLAYIRPREWSFEEITRLEYLTRFFCTSHADLWNVDKRGKVNGGTIDDCECVQDQTETDEKARSEREL